MKFVIYLYLKYKNIFAKGKVPNWSEEVFVIKKVKNIVPLILVYDVLVILKANNLLELFTNKTCIKTNKKEFSV